MMFRRRDPDDDNATFIPTPEQIARECERIKSGEIILSERSRQRWAELRRLREESDEWELSDTIPDDGCEMPEWFNG